MKYSVIKFCLVLLHKKKKPFFIHFQIWCVKQQQLKLTPINHNHKLRKVPTFYSENADVLKKTKQNKNAQQNLQQCEVTVF